MKLVNKGMEISQDSDFLRLSFTQNEMDSNIEDYFRHVFTNCEILWLQKESHGIKRSLGSLIFFFFF